MAIGRGIAPLPIRRATLICSSQRRSKIFRESQVMRGTQAVNQGVELIETKQLLDETRKRARLLGVGMLIDLQQTAQHRLGEIAALCEEQNLAGIQHRAMR